MKIIKLKASNIKGLKQVDIKPDENLVLVTGKNAQGKSSLLDCILYALGGGSVIGDKPIRKGETKGEIELDLGDIIVHRSFTDKGTYLDVKTKKHDAHFRKAQAKLDELIDALYFDPLEFIGLNEQEQREILFKSLGINVEKYDEEYGEVYEKRKEIGILLRQFKARLDSINKPEDSVFKKEPVDVSKLSNELSDLNENIENIRSSKQVIESNKNKIETHLEEIKQLKLENETIKKETDINKLETYVKEKENIKEALGTAQETNESIRQAKEYKQLEKEVQETDSKYKGFDNQLLDIKQKKKEELSKSNLPKGLDINEDGIFMNDVPIKQLSGAEKLKTSLEIATRIKSELKVIRIENGSLLDDKGIKEVKDIAKREG
jgi:DNA repair exonuclease SbcCD ATPase subunit